MSEEEIDKMKQKVNCNEDSNCNECPYIIGDECLLDLYTKQQKEIEEQKDNYDKLLNGYNKLVQEHIEAEKLIDRMAAI